jgi:hypothetical protein
MFGPPMDAFFKVQPSINPEGVEINPMLAKLMHTKRHAGDGSTDLNDFTCYLTYCQSQLIVDKRLCKIR